MKTTTIIQEWQNMFQKFTLGDMFYLNGSDTNWLVYADYLEDQGIDATHIREGVAEQIINTWCFSYHNFGFVGDNCNLVGAYGTVGAIDYNYFVDPYDNVGCYRVSSGVGK